LREKKTYFDRQNNLVVGAREAMYTSVHVIENHYAPSPRMFTKQFGLQSDGGKWSCGMKEEDGRVARNWSSWNFWR